MKQLQTGNRTVVTVEVPRDDVPRFSIMLLRPMGFDPGAGITNHVYLPATIEAFALVNAADDPYSGGVLADLTEPDLVPIRTNRDTFWGVHLAKLGSHFGWSARGVRIEFVSKDDETYRVTLSYELHTGSHEDWRLILLDTFLRNGDKSYSRALTERAARDFAIRIDTLDIPEAS